MVFNEGGCVAQGVRVGYMSGVAVYMSFVAAYVLANAGWFLGAVTTAVACHATVMQRL